MKINWDDSEAPESEAPSTGDAAMSMESGPSTSSATNQSNGAPHIGFSENSSQSAMEVM